MIVHLKIQNRAIESLWFNDKDMDQDQDEDKEGGGVGRCGGMWAEVCHVYDACKTQDTCTCDVIAFYCCHVYDACNTQPTCTCDVIAFYCFECAPTRGYCVSGTRVTHPRVTSSHHFRE